jgi:hypothetical protein
MRIHISVILLLLVSVAALKAQDYHPVALMRYYADHLADQPRIWSLKDYNHDGYNDFIVTGGGEQGYHQPTGFIFFGGSPIDSIPDMIIPSDTAHTGIYPLGDLDGDGGEEFGITSSDKRWNIFFSGNVGQKPDYIWPNLYGWAGMGLYPLDDVNEDGCGDLLRTTNVSADRRKPRILYQLMYGGRDFDTTWVWSMLQHEDTVFYFESAGDIFGDGQIDLVFGEETHNGPGQAPQTRNLLYLNVLHGDTIPNYDLSEHIPSNPRDSSRSFQAKIVKDITGDGYQDVILYFIGNQFPVSDTLYILNGGQNFDTYPDLKIPYTETWNIEDVENVGDVNYDGYDDLGICFSDNMNEPSSTLAGLTCILNPTSSCRTFWAGSTTMTAWHVGWLGEVI